MHRRFRQVVLLACLAMPSTAWPSGEARIKIDNFSFGPGDLVVDKGTDVTWTNQDDIPHSIVLTALGAGSKAIDTDQSFTYQFQKVGTYSYICGLHPQMHGKVRVK